ncbi:putative ankyrin repeat protein [Chloropicon roscoffensis]|uniref:Ankyrin repeat protein n=1 Tax=Chloropicon roscoffensis TaxID=1461544 RepID=A0AAX4PHC4_9CHLO
MVARGAESTSSAKRAKVDEAKEEEDPLVRRKEEVVRLLGRARKGKGNARAKKELLTLCADFEAKNEKLLGRLLPELWQKILDEYLHQNDQLAFAMTCRFFREKQKDLGWKIGTNLKEEHLYDLQKSGKVTSHSLGWFQWVCDTFKILPGYEKVYMNAVGFRYTVDDRHSTDIFDRQKAFYGDVHEGHLLNYAAFQGSVEILRWLMEEKGCKLNKNTGWYAGVSGSVEVLEHMRRRGRGRGYGKKFTKAACEGAAMGGHLKALKFLRGLDPPCPWNEETCKGAAQGGHLDVLKFLRAQNPPCPWDEDPCAYAADEGHLEVLKWLRSQDPPCPWDERTCLGAAAGGHLDVLKWARSEDPPCPWNEETCAWAAGVGHLEVLKFARGQDPPCPWDEETCTMAAKGGHLEVLKWLRSQDPPCPWDGETCASAAREGRLEVLKFARGQDPPCPWSRSGCREEVEWWSDHQHIVKWIDQQKDESDVELSDSDSD